MDTDAQLFEHIQKLPKASLDKATAAMLADNGAANAKAHAIGRALDQNRQQRAELERKLAEQVGVCQYTAERAVAFYKAAQEKSAPAAKPKK